MIAPLRGQAASTKPSRSDVVMSAITIMEVPEYVVTKWLGDGVGCFGRLSRLNALVEWANRVQGGDRPSIDGVIGDR